MDFQIVDLHARSLNHIYEVVLYGRTDTDESVCVRIHGYRPYMYVPGQVDDCRRQELESIASNIVSCDTVETRRSAVGFGPPVEMTKVEFADPYSIRSMGDELFDRGGGRLGTSYNSDFAAELMCLADLGISAGGWVRVLNINAKSCKKTSTCDHEYIVDINGLESCDSEYAGINADLRIMMYDIEAAAEAGKFPEPKEAPIIQISACIKHLSQGADEPPTSFVIFTWRPGPVDDKMPAESAFNGHVPEYRCFVSEHEMLLAWFEYIRVEDPDVISGWNTQNFDNVYVVRRFARLSDRDSVCHLGRDIHQPTIVRERSGGGKQVVYMVNIHGRANIDMYVVVRKALTNYRSYKLDAVARDMLVERNVFDFTTNSPSRDEIGEIYVFGGPANARWEVVDGNNTIVSGKGVTGTCVAWNHDRDGHFLVRFPDSPNVPNDAPIVVAARSGDGSLASRMVKSIPCGRWSKYRKEDVTHDRITPLWNGTDEDRTRLAHYNAADSMLPMRIAWHTQAIHEYIAKSQVTGLPMTMLAERGQNIQTTSAVYRVAGREGFAIPRTKNYRTGHSCFYGQDETYQGAMVLEPMDGFYGPDQVIATLDFTSLYPSLMDSHNLCPSTQLTSKKSIRHLQACVGDDQCIDDYVHAAPNGEKYVRQNILVGLMPIVVRGLLEARGHAKKLKSDAGKRGDVLMAIVYDKLQLALKLVCNSVYGYLGDQNSPIPAKSVAASITAYGRDSLEHHTVALLKKWYPGLRVVYGDTDSVFIQFERGMSIEDTMELAKKACARINQHFKDENPYTVMNLDFEKLLCPFVILKKKRYVGTFWTRTDGPDFVYMKGIEAVRMDQPPFIRVTLRTMIHFMFWENDIEMALAVVREAVRRCYLLEHPIEFMTMTRELRDAEYKGTLPPHAAVARNRMRRDASDVVPAGTRVGFIVVAGSGNVGDRAMDPAYAMSKDSYPDPTWYVKKLEDVVTRIAEPIVGARKCRELFHGSHTRKRTVRVMDTPLTRYFKRMR